MFCVAELKEVLFYDLSQLLRIFSALILLEMINQFS